MKLWKRIGALVLIAALLPVQAFAAADQKPRDPGNPYVSSVTGMFHRQDTGSEENPGRYSVFLPESLGQCVPGVLIVVPGQSTAEDFAEGPIGKQWQDVCEKYGMAAVFTEAMDGKAWNLNGNGRDEIAYLKQVSDHFHSKSKSRDAAFNLNERAFYAVGYGDGGAVLHAFAMAWPQMLCGAASVGSSAVPDAVATRLGNALSFPFAQAGSLSGQQENNLPNKKIPLPVWIVEGENAADNSAMVRSHWIAANEAEQTSANLYAQLVYANGCKRVWVTDSAHAAQATPEVLYAEFLSKVQRFVGDPGGRLAWTVEHTNNGQTGFFYSEEQIDGHLRRWLTYVPSSYRAGAKLPLVVAIHGYSSSIFAFTGDSRWQDVAEKNRFIVVFPQAYVNEFPSRGEVYAPVWHTYSYALTETAVDDVAFIRQLVGLTKERYGIDETRVYATGHSNGATMTWALGLDAAELFAAIAPIGHNSGSYRGAPGNNNMGPTDRLSSTTPARECSEILPVWMFKGSYDVDGGATFDNLHLWDTNSNSEALAHWTARNGAAKTPAAQTTDTSGRYRTSIYRASGSSAPLVQYTVVDNSPHAYLPNEAELIWNEFFSQYSRKNGTLYYRGNAVRTTPEKAAVHFADIGNHWAKTAIEETVQAGLLSGSSDTAFGPTEPVSRGLAIQSVGRAVLAVGAPVLASETFEDVDYSDSFAPYVGWALQKGIIQPDSSRTYRPKEAITREAFAVLLADCIEKSGKKLSQISGTAPYADAAEISSQATTAVNNMRAAGIMSGRGNNRFDPQGILTLAELAVILQRITA